MTVAPLVVVAITSFNAPNTPVAGFQWPDPFTLESFGSAWVNGGFGSAFLDNTLITAGVVFIVTVCSISAGYAFGTMRFPGSRWFYYLFLIGIVTPYVVLVVPLYLQFQALGILGTYWAIIIPEAAMYLGFGVFWMQAFFASIPRSLIEAARLDGASSFRILVTILIPLARPAITTLMMLTFLSSWNEYLVPLVMAAYGDITTVSLGLASFQGQYLTDIPSLAAASVVVALPAVLIYVITQRTFFRGLLQGAVKE
ncbi:carbohydrate ABC transporter permease [Microbacterium lacus]|uniref:carbohydrate ABC transporter permease n=1 Tax=Microbacterium lacus TaxID=415217 RepID=UPI0031D54270